MLELPCMLLFVVFLDFPENTLLLREDTPLLRVLSFKRKSKSQKDDHVGVLQKTRHPFWWQVS